MEKRLVVLDVDDTAVEWEYGEFISFYPRTGIYELLETLGDHNIDVALFSTASLKYVVTVANTHFSEYTFVRLLGSNSVTLHKNEKVKDLGIFLDDYELKNIVLVDDKPRNGRMYPDNFIAVRPPSYYTMRNKFDSELSNTLKKILKYFKE